jgi:hypothetical protein
LALENIARRQKYPCANRQNGCLELFSIQHIAEHGAVCVYGKIKCPLHFIGRCSWKGLKKDMKEHVKAAHRHYVLEESSFDSPYLSDSVAILSCFDELFTCYVQKRNGRYYGAVQLIGTSSEASKYKCEFTLLAPNGIEQISKTFLVQDYSEEFKAIFQSGKCLILEEVTVRNFFVQNEINWNMKLSRV